MLPLLALSPSATEHRMCPHHLSSAGALRTRFTSTARRGRRTKDERISSPPRRQVPPRPAKIFMGLRFAFRAVIDRPSSVVLSQLPGVAVTHLRYHVLVAYPVGRPGSFRGHREHGKGEQYRVVVHAPADEIFPCFV